MVRIGIRLNGVVENADVTFPSCRMRIDPDWSRPTLLNDVETGVDVLHLRVHDVHERNLTSGKSVEGISQFAASQERHGTGGSPLARQSDPYRQSACSGRLVHDQHAVDVHHHFQHQQVCACLGHDRCLFFGVAAQVFRFRQIFRKGPVRYAPGHQDVRSRHAISRLPGQLDASAVQLFKLILDPRINQHVPMRGKRVRYDDFCAFANVILMNCAKNVRMAQCAAAVPGVVQLGNAASLDFRTGCAVNENPFALINALHQSFVAVHWRSFVGFLPRGRSGADSWIDESCENYACQNLTSILTVFKSPRPHVPVLKRKPGALRNARNRGYMAPANSGWMGK